MKAIIGILLLATICSTSARNFYGNIAPGNRYGRFRNPSPPPTQVSNRGRLCRYGVSFWDCCRGWQKDQFGACNPVCQKECVHGDCVAPDRCECHEGWMGATCEKDFNECAVRPCQHRCMNQPGSYRCYCEHGYALMPDNHRCQRDKRCLTKHCSFACRRKGRKIECACPPGWELAPDGKNCRDIDECTTGTANCEPDLRCQNSMGDYICLCPVGQHYEYSILLKKYKCEDDKGCAQSPCFPGVTCTPQAKFNIDARYPLPENVDLRLYRCGPCPEGFEGDGETCAPKVASTNAPQRITQGISTESFQSRPSSSNSTGSELRANSVGVITFPAITKSDTTAVSGKTNASNVFGEVISRSVIYRPYNRSVPSSSAPSTAKISIFPNHTSWQKTETNSSTAPTAESTNKSTTVNENSTPKPTTTPLPKTTLQPATTTAPTSTSEPTATKKPTTSMPTTTPEPTTTLSTTTNKPTTTMAITTTPEPTTTSITTTTPEPTTTTIPTTTPEPTTTTLPTTTQEPTTTTIPTTTPEPTTTNLPTTTPEPTTTTIPTTTPEPTTTTLPTTTPEPTTTTIPTTTTEPTTTTLPTTTPELTTTTIPTTTPEPTTTAIPTTTVEPSTTTITTTTQKTTTTIPSTTPESTTTMVPITTPELTTTAMPTTTPEPTTTTIPITTPEPTTTTIPTTKFEPSTTTITTTTQKTTTIIPSTTPKSTTTTVPTTTSEPTTTTMPTTTSEPTTSLPTTTPKPTTTKIPTTTLEPTTTTKPTTTPEPTTTSLPTTTPEPPTTKIPTTTSIPTTTKPTTTPIPTTTTIPTTTQEPTTTTVPTTTTEATTTTELTTTPQTTTNPPTTPTPPQEIIIFTTEIDEDMKPIHNAEVALYRFDKRGDVLDPLIEITDEDGLVALPVPEGEHFVIYVSKPGYIEASKTFLWVPFGRNMLTFRLRSAEDARQQDEFTWFSGFKKTRDFSAHGGVYTAELLAGALDIEERSDVRLSLLPVNVSNPEELKKAPELLANSRSPKKKGGNVTHGLEVYGMAEFRIERAGSDDDFPESLDVLRPVNLVIPITGPTESLSNFQKITAWYFDEFMGYWREEGKGTVRINNGIWQWEYSTKRFTWWAVGRKFMETSCAIVRTCYDADCNEPAPFIPVTMVGTDFAYTTQKMTDVKGKTCFNFKLGGNVRFSSHCDPRGNSVEQKSNRKSPMCCHDNFGRQLVKHYVKSKKKSNKCAKVNLHISDRSISNRCPDPTTVADKGVEYSYTGIAVGSIATAFCKSNRRKILGQDTHICFECGDWSGLQPQCIRTQRSASFRRNRDIVLPPQVRTPEERDNNL